MKYDLILLDLDGTILDFKTSQKKAFKSMLKDLKIEFKEEYLALYSEVNASYWKRLEKGEITKDYLKEHRFKDFFKQIGITNEEDENKIFLSHLSKCTDKIIGADELLESLKGSVKLIAATNGIKTVQNSRLKETDYHKYFDLVITSEEIGFEKPSPEFYDYCLQQFPEIKKERILMIGDSLSSDITGAINYGIDSCWFNPNGKTTDKNPTYTISSLREINEIILL